MCACASVCAFSNDAVVLVRWSMEQYFRFEQEQASSLYIHGMLALLEISKHGMNCAIAYVLAYALVRLCT